MHADAPHPARVDADQVLQHLIADGVIVCPVTRGRLQEQDGRLRADATAYEVEDGIPRLRPPREQPAGNDPSPPRESSDDPA